LGQIADRIKRQQETQTVLQLGLRDVSTMQKQMAIKN
jgi:hypothetical protein